MERLDTFFRDQVGGQRTFTVSPLALFIPHSKVLVFAGMAGIRSAVALPPTFIESGYPHGRFKQYFGTPTSARHSTFTSRRLGQTRWLPWNVWKEKWATVGQLAVLLSSNKWVRI
jgi:hypothetical protein